MSDWILDFPPSPRFPVHTRGNVSEVFPDPITPLNATTGFLQNFEDGYRDAFVEAGVWDESIYEGEVRFALLGCLGGFVYINMSYLRVFAVRTPGYTPELIDMSYGVDSEEAPYAAERQDWHDAPERTAEVQRWIDTQVFAPTGLPDYDAERTEVLAFRAGRPDLATLSDADLVARIRDLNPVLRRLFQRHSEASLKAGFALGSLVAAATEAGRAELAFEVVSGVGEIDSLGPTLVLSALAARIRKSEELEAAFDAGLDGLHDRLADVDPEFHADVERQVRGEWGFRGPGEWELRADTWETKVQLAYALVDRMRRPGGEVEAQVRLDAVADKRRAAYDELASSLSGEALAALEAGSRAAGLWVRARERSRTTSAMLLHEQRIAAHELGRRGHENGVLAEPKQVYMLLESELDDWLADPAAWTDRLADRERTYLSLYDLVPPFTITGEVPDRSTWRRRDDEPEPVAEGSELTGSSGAPGTFTGRARVVRSASEVDELEPGDVLVAAVTDPSWTPLFLTCGAVVTEVGGIFSHGPIVCRELGTPCVVAVDDACRRIPDGATVVVDGTAGTVTVLDEA